MKPADLRARWFNNRDSLTMNQLVSLRNVSNKSTYPRKDEVIKYQNFRKSINKLALESQVLAKINLGLNQK